MTTHARPIDKEFEDADDTGILVLSGRNLRGFPGVPVDQCDVGYVFEADFSRNRFDRFPEELCQLFTSLSKLNFYHNCLRNVPEDISLLTNLKELNLSRNFLCSVPAELCTLQLHSLDLNNNRLVSLPVELGSFQQLRHLDLSCNTLPDLPVSICQLAMLQHLDLHRNELKELPVDFFKLRFTFLDLSANCITRLPTSLKANDTLVTFIVKDNPLECPPALVCMRGLSHAKKYLENLEKRGSDSHLSISSSNREDSIRRRQRQSNKKMINRPSADLLPNKEKTLIDEMASLVNSVFIREDLHLPKVEGTADPSREYREAAQRLYLQQERNKAKVRMYYRSNSPPPGHTSVPGVHTTQSSTHYGTLPKRKGNAVVGDMGEGDGPAEASGSVSPSSRSLPNEKTPRSGSWHSNQLASSPVMPPKYALPPEKTKGAPEEEADITPLPGPPAKPDERLEAVKDYVRRNAMSSSSSSSANVNKPLHLDLSVGVSSDKEKGPPSRDGSITPTNPSPVHEEGDGVHTPSDEIAGTAPVDAATQLAEVSAALECLDNVLGATNPGLDDEPSGEGEATLIMEPAVINITFTSSPCLPPQLVNIGPEAAPVVTDTSLGPSPTVVDTTPTKTPIVCDSVISSVATIPSTPSADALPVTNTSPTPSTSSPTSDTTASTPSPITTPVQTPTHQSGDTQFVMMEIQELEEEPIGGARGHSGTAEGTWPRGGKAPPVSQRKKGGEKDVFKFLRSQDPNFTIRRQQQHMSRIFEKHQALKTQLEGMLGISLPQELGEAFGDGVVLCELINKLQPNLVPNIRKPTEGQHLSRVGQTQNIQSFIISCKKLQVPEEKLCSAGDITEFKDPVRVMALIEYLLEMTTFS